VRVQCMYAHGPRHANYPAPFLRGASASSEVPLRSVGGETLRL